MDLPDFLIKNSTPTGSHFICDPPVTNTDIDYVFLVTSTILAYDTLIDRGWTDCGHDGYELGSFVALRKGNLNYILVDDEVMFDRWEAATLLAKKRNLLDKQDRIKLFNNINTKGIQDANEH